MSWIDGRLTGRRILLVAEPAFSVDYLAQVLAAAGAEAHVSGPNAVSLLPRIEAGEFDAAVLDLGIAPLCTLQLTAAIVEVRRQVLLTAGSGVAVPRLLASYPVLHQPFAAFQVVDRLESILTTCRSDKTHLHQ